MGVRQRLGAAARGLLGIERTQDPPPFSRAEAEALRLELEQQHEQLAREVQHLTEVATALQEQLDRWAQSTSTSTDSLSERVVALERASRDIPSA